MLLGTFHLKNFRSSYSIHCLQVPDIHSHTIYIYDETNPHSVWGRLQQTGLPVRAPALWVAAQRSTARRHGTATSY